MIPLYLVNQRPIADGRVRRVRIVAKKHSSYSCYYTDKPGELARLGQLNGVEVIEDGVDMSLDVDCLGLLIKLRYDRAVPHGCNNRQKYG